MKWTNEELQALERAYEQRIQPRYLLSDRSESSIRHKASRLGLKWWRTKDVCRKCGIALTSENWYRSAKERRDRVCKPCLIKSTAGRRELDPLRAKRWNQRNQLHTNGQTITCRKRAKPEKCELCEKKVPKAYHHWGPIAKGKFVLGAWVCHRCHQFIELFELGYSKPWVKLKEGIENESRPHIGR